MVLRLKSLYGVILASVSGLTDGFVDHLGDVLLLSLDIVQSYQVISLTLDKINLNQIKFNDSCSNTTYWI